jgi:hypothetical protein
VKNIALQTAIAVPNPNRRDNYFSVLHSGQLPARQSHHGTSFASKHLKLKAVRLVPIKKFSVARYLLNPRQTGRAGWSTIKHDQT